MPASAGDAGARLAGDATPRRRDAISTSTLPFGASSLPTLAPPCRQELQDRCGMVEIVTRVCCVARGCLSRETPVGYVYTPKPLPCARSLQSAHVQMSLLLHKCAMVARSFVVPPHITLAWFFFLTDLGSVRFTLEDSSRACPFQRAQEDTRSRILAQHPTDHR